MKAFSEINKFKFVCPIFGAEVFLRGCLQLRELWALGKPVAVRKGCQACMSSGKCPVIHMISEMQRKGAEMYFSKSEEIVPLGADTINRIAPILMQDSHLKQFSDMTPRELELIMSVNGLSGSANLKVRSGVLKERVEDVPRKRATEKTRTVIAAPETVSEAVSAVVAAATSGNLGAAINQEINQ